VSSIFSGGPEGETKRPGYTRGPGEFLGGNEFPYDTGGYGPALDQRPGYFGDVGLGQMFPYQNLYGGIQQNYPNIQRGGQYFADLGLQGTTHGQQSTTDLANQAWGNAGWAGAQLPQTSNLMALAMPAFGVANQFAQGLSPAIHGLNTQGGSGAGQQAMGAGRQAMGVGQQVLNAGLGFGADLADIQQRAIAEGLPQVRASYSARGLGTSGEAARGEQDYVQRISDQMAQEAIQARLGGLGIAAQGANAYGQGAGVVGQGAGVAANEAAAFGNIGLGRGALSAQAAQLPGSVLNQFLQGQGQGLQNFGQVGNILTQAGQQQFQPLQLAGLGAGVWGQGQQFPLDYANTLFQASRQPYNWLANWMNAVPNIGSTGQAEGFLGIG
jgi:hypothetical protein